MKYSYSFAAMCRAAAMAISIIASFVSLKLYNLYLSKEIYGTILVASQFLAYLPLVGGGLSMVLGQQMLATKVADEKRRLACNLQIIQTYVCLIALAVSMAVMTVYAHMPVARHSGLPIDYFYVLGLAGVITLHTGNQVGIFSGLGFQVYTVILNGAGSLASLAILWIGFRGGLGPWAMPLATAGGMAILVPGARVIQLRIVPGLPYLSLKWGADLWERVKGMLPSAANWLQSQFLIMLLYSIDLLWMGFSFGASAVAVYGIVSRIVAMSGQMINTLGDAMWPNLAAEHDPQRKIHLMRKVDRLNAWVAGGWFGAVAATLHPFLDWFMKADWVVGSSMIYVIVSRSLVSSFSAPHGYGLLSAGRFTELARSVRRELILVTILMVIGSRFMGPISIPLAALLGTAGGSLWYLTYLYFKPAEHTAWYKEWLAIYIRGIVAVAIAFTVASAAWYIAGAILHFKGWASIIAGACGFAAALLAGMATAYLRGGPTFRPLGLPVKLPAQW